MPIGTGLGNSFQGLGHRSNHLCLWGSTALSRHQEWEIKEIMAIWSSVQTCIHWACAPDPLSLGNTIIWGSIQNVQQPDYFPFCPGVWQSEAAPEADWNHGIFEENLRATSDCWSLQLTQREKCPQQVFTQGPTGSGCQQSLTPGWKKKTCQ